MACGSCKRIEWRAVRPNPSLARVVLHVRLHGVDERAIIAQSRTVIPRRTRQCQRAIRTPCTQTVVVLHRQTQLHTLCLAQSFREMTSLSA